MHFSHWLVKSGPNELPWCWSCQSLRVHNISLLPTSMQVILCAEKEVEYLSYQMLQIMAMMMLYRHLSFSCSHLVPIYSQYKCVVRAQKLFSVYKGTVHTRTDSFTCIVSQDCHDAQISPLADVMFESCLSDRPPLSSFLSPFT